jgi:hypothetical protein
VRTVFTTPLPEKTEANLPEAVTFQVEATSDPNTPVTYTWYRQTKDCPAPTWCPIDNSPVNAQIGDEGTLTLTETKNEDLGVYRCVASNGISEAVSETKFAGPEISKLCKFFVNSLQPFCNNSLKLLTDELC